MSLRKQAAKRDTLYAAWESIKKNPRSHGIDQETIEDFKKDFHSNLKSINHELRSNQYSFQGLRGHRHKKGGKERILKISTIGDRIVQKAILITIKDKFPDPECSYGYVEGRTIKDAADKIHEAKKAGFACVLEADIVKFFDRVDKKLLLKKLKSGLGKDHSLDKLLKGFVYNKLGNRKDFSAAELADIDNNIIGMPQGGNLSPLCANIYLNIFDRTMMGKGYKLIRYADDFIVLCKTRDEAEKAHRLCVDIIEKGLKLELHRLGGPKTKISSFAEGFRFLGLSFKDDHITPAQESQTRLFNKIRYLFKPDDKVMVLDTLNECSRIITSWAKHYRFFHDPYPHDTFRKVDDFIRKQLSFYLRIYGLLPDGHTISEKQRLNLKINFVAKIIGGKPQLSATKK